MGKWIDFIEQPSKGITKIFKVISKEGGDDLGTIKWYTSWRCYTFQPDSKTIFEIDCLTDINTFLKDLMDNRKKLKESMNHIKLFESFVNEQEWDGKSREVKIGKVGNFDLIYQIFSKVMKGNGINGTIRTKPENYYVATITDEGNIEFDELEVTTKEINKEEVKKLFNAYKNSFG